MRKSWRWGVLLGAVLLLLATNWGCTAVSQRVTAGEGSVLIPPGSQRLPIEAQTMVGDVTLYLEVARTPEQQRIGLMHRQSVGATCGMVFPFEPPRPVGFWMKNVPIPLDMVFLRANIVRAIVTAPPCTSDPCPTYGPREPIDAVLELAGGRADELGLASGDRLDFQAVTGDLATVPCP